MMKQELSPMFLLPFGRTSVTARAQHRRPGGQGVGAVPMKIFQADTVIS